MGTINHAPTKECHEENYISFSLLVLLASCASKEGGIKLDDVLKVANSASAKNILKVAASADPKSAAKAMVEYKREQWERDPMQLARDLKTPSAISTI